MGLSGMQSGEAQRWYDFVENEEHTLYSSCLLAGDNLDAMFMIEIFP